MLRSATREIAASSTVTGAGKTKSLGAVNFVFDTGVEYGFGEVIVVDVFVKGDFDATEDIDNGDE